MMMMVDTSGETRVAQKGLPRRSEGRIDVELGHRLLLATDLTPASHRAEARAIELAVLGGRRLRVVVITPARSSPDQERERLAELVERARRQGVDADGVLVVSDDPGAAILASASAYGAHAIVVGLGAWDRRDRSRPACGYLANHARYPVLVTG